MHPATSREIARPSAASTDVARLKGIAARMRIDIVEMLARAGSGHPGGSLSAIDMVTALYFEVRRGREPVNPENWLQRR